MTVPLRIAFFLYEFPALSETFILNQITGLLELGHDVTIFAVRPRREPKTHPDVARYRLAERTTYQAMPERRIRRVAKLPVRLLQVSWRGWLPLLRSLNPVRYRGEALSLRLFYWAASLVGHRSFDVIQCHFGPAGRTAAFLREIGAIEGRLVVAFHGVDVSAYLRDDPHFYRHLFAHGDSFLPISETWRRRLLAFGCDPRRTHLHRMGVDVRRFPPSRHPQRHGRFRILTIGRLIEKKGVHFGLHAVAELMHRQAALDYTIVGDGPMRAQLERQAAELQLDGHVSFLGWQDQDTVAALLQASDVLLAPSVTDANGDQEGIPVTLMEAMAIGLPVVSTRHSGIPELVEHGVSGLLAPERDVIALADAMALLLQDQGLRERMGQAARKRIADAFDVAVLNRRLVEHYRELLG